MFDTEQLRTSLTGQIGWDSRDLKYLESEARSRFLDFQQDGLRSGQVRSYSDLHHEIILDAYTKSRYL